MTPLLKAVLTVATVAVAAQASAQVTFHEREGFQGRTFTTERPVTNFQRYGFNDRASSVVVLRDRWEVCSDAQFKGRCVVLRPGRYASLAEMGMNDRASSARLVGRNVRVSNDRFVPVPVPVYDNHRRPNERLYQANVTSVRAVLGKPEQRCWVEREQVAPEQRGDVNVGAAIVGAVLGGVLGHQVGGGRGKDIATAGGAVAGAALGANVGRDGGQPAITRDVRRCDTAPSQARPDYWDVSYVFRGQEHHIQMVSPPGRTITVNRRGEPRA
ncbi:MAG: beta/gamma crystallin-related protein [Burkholderiales bacterium]